MEQEKELNIEEKEARWIAAIKRKTELRTAEEFDFEMFYQTLYKDDHFELSVEYHGTEYGFTFFKDMVTSPTGEIYPQGVLLSDNIEELLDYPLYRYTKDVIFKGKTLRDYMREKEFPITFKTWED